MTLFTAGAADGGHPAHSSTRPERIAVSAVFNTPSGPPAEQDAIARHVADLIDATPGGAVIRVALFHLRSESLARHLIAAAARGVRVHVVTDASTRRAAAYRRIAAALGGDRQRASWIVACTHGCVGDKIMHNKFYLFSRTGPARDVVVQTSANATTTDRVHAWNNAVTFSDPALYRAYDRYFSALAARRHHKSHYRVTRSGDMTFYTFPRAGTTARTDTLDQLLRPVGCAGGTAVRVAVYAFSRTRIARRLRSLARRGCHVSVVYTSLGAGVRRILTHVAGLRLRDSHYRYPGARTGRPARAWVHSKYVLVDGRYGGRRRWLVITGSPNITGPALRRNDEAMLSIADPGLHAAYAANFADLWRTAGAYDRRVSAAGAEPRATRHG